MSAEEAVRRIVVGVDGSTASIRALRWSLRQAEATGALVEAVICWDVPTAYGFGPTVVAGEDLAGTAQRTLAAALGELPTKPLDGVLRQRVLRGHPAAVLIDEAKGADLLVVGSHGRGGFVGALLGSVSQYCVQHATCPVVVVRTEDET